MSCLGSGAASRAGGQRAIRWSGSYADFFDIHGSTGEISVSASCAGIRDQDVFSGARDPHRPFRHQHQHGRRRRGDQSGRRRDGRPIGAAPSDRGAHGYPHRLRRLGFKPYLDLGPVGRPERLSPNSGPATGACTPLATDEDHCLRVTVAYIDGHDSGKDAQATSTRLVRSAQQARLPEPPPLTASGPPSLPGLTIPFVGPGGLSGLPVSGSCTIAWRCSESVCRQGVPAHTESRVLVRSAEPDCRQPRCYSLGTVASSLHTAPKLRSGRPTPVRPSRCIGVSTPPLDLGRRRLPAPSEPAVVAPSRLSSKSLDSAQRPDLGLQSVLDERTPGVTFSQLFWEIVLSPPLRPISPALAMGFPARPDSQTRRGQFVNLPAFGNWRPVFEIPLLV